MFVDLRIASAQFARDHVGPIGGPKDSVCCWQIGEATSREELHALVDQMWDAVEKKANEFQGSQSQVG